MSSNIFKFKAFQLIQDQNPQKVGTDSMLLGAWVSQQLKQTTIDRILDIGTGTGILALMMAQEFGNAQVTAIEPDHTSFEEAYHNFSNSDFSGRIMGIQSPLQQFGAMEKFDLIITNPPYYDGSYISENEMRNAARHTLDLPIHELYECAEDLLTEEGKMAVVIPVTELTSHLERAFDNDLYLSQILFSLRENGSRKRAFIILGREEVDPAEEELLVKDARNEYSDAYIQLTKQFYATDLAAKKKGDL